VTVTRRQNLSRDGGEELESSYFVGLDDSWDGLDDSWDDEPTDDDHDLDDEDGPGRGGQPPAEDGVALSPLACPRSVDSEPSLLDV
jgi:hypothetical protein